MNLDAIKNNAAKAIACYGYECNVNIRINEQDTHLGGCEIDYFTAGSDVMFHISLTIREYTSRVKVIWVESVGTIGVNINILRDIIKAIETKK